MSPASYERFVAILRAGGVVACPTETLVGLLADAFDARAVERIVTLKGRDPHNPMGVLLPGFDALESVVSEVPERARMLAERHWPGPLTLVLRARATLAGELTKDGKIGVRVPGPSPALELVRAFGGPLTATSANRTGQPACRTSAEARAVFGGMLDGYVEGDSPGSLPSTVVDASSSELVVLRQGAVRLDGP